MSMDDRIPAALSDKHSPFIPDTGIQFAWDSVSLTTALSCWRRYQYMILEGRTPKSSGYAIALEFGILFHLGLERYHKLRFAGASHLDAVHNAIAAVLEQPAAERLPTDEDNDDAAAEHNPDEDDGIALRNSKVRTRYYLARSIVWYLEQYADDPCQTLALPSGKPAVEVSFRIPLPVEVADQSLILCGHIDRAVTFNGFLYVSDYKTAKGLTQQWKESFDLSHQMTGYSIAGSVLFEKPTSGIMIDGVALQIGGVKTARHFTKRTSGQIKEYFTTLRDTAERAAQLWDDYGSAARDYPMNTSACFLCAFKEVCRQPPEFRASYLDQWFHRGQGWNPLANR